MKSLHSPIHTFIYTVHMYSTITWISLRCMKWCFISEKDWEFHRALVTWWPTQQVSQLILTASKPRQAVEVSKKSALCEDERLSWRRRGHSACHSATGRRLRWRCSTLDDTKVASRPCTRFGQSSWRCNLPSTATLSPRSPFWAAGAIVSEKEQRVTQRY